MIKVVLLSSGVVASCEMGGSASTTMIKKKTARLLEFCYEAVACAQNSVLSDCQGLGRNQSILKEKC